MTIAPSIDADAPVILCFAPQTCARVPLIALEETGARFETRLVAFMKGEHRGPDYLAINPAGKVPALIVEGGTITQNPAILTWLAARFPAAGLLPAGGDALAQAALLAKLCWFSADLHPLVTRIRMPHFFCDLDNAPARVRELACEAMAFQLAKTEAQLAAAPWLLGEEWSVLDAYLFWVWFRITGAGFDACRLPAIAAHSRRMEERPAVQRALARERAAEDTLAAQGLAVPLR